MSICVSRAARAGAVIIALSGIAQPARAFDLLEVYELARKNDPTYLAAGAVHEQALDARNLARAPLLPQAEVSGSAARVDQDFNDVGSNFTSTNFELRISQAVFRPDLLVALRQAGTAIEKANVDYAFSAQALMLRVAQAYFGVLEANDDLDSARANREAISQQLKQAQQRFDVGLIAITGVEEAKARYDLATAEELRAVNAQHDAREELREITGEYPATLAVLGGEMPLVTPEPVDIDAWTGIALEQNLEIASASFDVATARDEIRRLQSLHLPTASVVGARRRSTGGASGLQGGGREITSNSIGIELRLSLYEGGAIAIQTRQARAAHREALNLYEGARRRVQSQTRQSFLGVQTGISRVTALRQAVVSNRSALDAVQAGFQVGTRTSVDVLDAQRELFRARFDYAAARYEYIVDSLSLKQAAGILSKNDLRLVNQWLLE